MNGIIIHYEEYEAQLSMLDNEQTGLLLKPLQTLRKRPFRDFNTTA